MSQLADCWLLGMESMIYAECIIMRRREYCDDARLMRAPEIIEEPASIDTVVVIEMCMDDPAFGAMRMCSASVGAGGSVLSLREWFGGATIGYDEGGAREEHEAA